MSPERDLLNEIGRMSFGCGLGLLEGAMLLEGFSASFSGDGRVNNRGNAGGDPDFNEIVDRLMANNEKAGSPVPREKVEEMVRKDPAKYSKAAFRTPTRAEIHNSMSLNAPSARQVRDSFYKAVVATVGRLYEKYGIPFDKDTALNAVRKNDHYAKTVMLDRTVGVPKYTSFDMLNSDNDVYRLCGRNYALKKVMDDARTFLREGGKAKAEGRLDQFLKDFGEERSNAQFMMSLAANEEKEYEPSRVVPEPEPEPLGKERFTDFQYICDFAKRYSKLAYPAIYERFKKVASPEELAAAPAPGETPYAYLARLQMPKGELEMVFAAKLNNMLTMAYTPDELNNAYMEVASSPSRDIRDYFNAAVGDVDGNDMVKPEAKKMYSVWKGFRDIDEACRRVTGKPFFNRQ